MTYSVYNIRIDNNAQYIDGNQAVNKILTSDADGNLTWRAPSLTYSQMTGYVSSWTGNNTLGTSSIKLTSNNIDVYTINQTTATISGVYTQSLTQQQYIFNLSGNTTFGFSNPNISSYNFLFNCATYSLTLASGVFKTPGATALAATGSIIISGVYDGSRMWISSVTNYSNL